MFLKKALSLVLSLLLAFNYQSLSFAQSAASVLNLPQPGTMIGLTLAYVPVIAKGLSVHPENPILFDFIFDTGNSGLTAKDPGLKIESEKLVKYFLASLTVPDDDQWVNLSPYEKDHIVPGQLGQTEMGRDMLAQDYILKQLTASLIYPEKQLGKEFWNKVYSKAQQLYGSTEVPVNTFNKVWIVANKADVYVHGNTAFVTGAYLKVMLEEDYLSLGKHNGISNQKGSNTLGSQVIREVVIPELEKEVNQGKNFANLRQIFYSMILATWYKKNLKEALLNQVYSNKAKINGVDVEDKTIKEQIYQQYLQAYKKGVFNYIKEDVKINGQSVARKYFSGGVAPNLGVSHAMIVRTTIGRDADLAGQYVQARVTTPKVTAGETSAAMTVTTEPRKVIGQLAKDGSFGMTKLDNSLERFLKLQGFVYTFLKKVDGQDTIKRMSLEEEKPVFLDNQGKEIGNFDVSNPHGGAFHFIRDTLDNLYIVVVNPAMTVASPATVSAAMTSPLHEQLGREYMSFANGHKGVLPQPIHPIKRFFRIADIKREKKGLDLLSLSEEERRVEDQVAWNEIIRLSKNNEKIAAGVMAAGAASRALKGRLPFTFVRAMKDDPDQFVDQTKFSQADIKIINEQFAGDYKGYVRSLDPAIDAQHDVLNSILHESKALLPTNKEPINGKWYNFLGYNALNIKKINDQLEAIGLNRVFIFKVMANESNYKKILDNLVRNNFFGLKVSLVKDVQGNVVDIDHMDPSNEIILYSQGTGYRVVAPVATVEDQWRKDKKLIEQAVALSATDPTKSGGLLAKTQLASETDYLQALEFSKKYEGKVLYDTAVPEGHGERFHAQFETYTVGPKVPNLVLDVVRKIRYDYFHNIDNMATIDDDWISIFGWMLRNDKKVVFESSLKPVAESAGGGFDVTDIVDSTGKVIAKDVVRQTEGAETDASLNPTVSPNYDRTAEEARSKEIIDGVANQGPVNNASELSVSPTIETLRAGGDAFSANLPQAMREELAATLEEAIRSGKLDLNLKKFADASRQAYGFLSTPKVVAYQNSELAPQKQKVLSIVSETLAWNSQLGFLANNGVGVVLTGSVVDTEERGLPAEKQRFNPFKQRVDVDNPLASESRQKQTIRMLDGELLSSRTIDFGKKVVRDLKKISMIATKSAELVVKDYNKNETYQALYLTSVKEEWYTPLNILLNGHLKEAKQALKVGKAVERLGDEAKAQWSLFAGYLAVKYNLDWNSFDLLRRNLDNIARIENDLKKFDGHSLKVIGSDNEVQPIMQDSKRMWDLWIESDSAMISDIDPQIISAATEAGLSIGGLLSEFTESHLHGGGSFQDYVKARIAEAHAQVRKNEESGEVDKATVSTPKKYGGIDLNSKNIQMDVYGDKIDIKFDPAMIAQFKSGDFSGVHPVIINITPILSIFPLLGLKEDEELGRLAKV